MTKREGGGNISKLSGRATGRTQKVKENLKKFLTKRVDCARIQQVPSKLYLVN